VKRDIYAGNNEEEAADAYFDAWFEAGSWNGQVPDVVLDMARYAFRWGFGQHPYLFDRDFWPDGHQYFGFINAAHVAGSWSYDEWTEGN
jgi:hypothetical protein